MALKDLNNLSIEELRKIKDNEKNKLKKEYKKYQNIEKQKLIDEIKELLIKGKRLKKL